jgi:fructose-1,6-bisphosphatase II
VKALGGLIQGRLAPRDDAEREKGEVAGLLFDHVYEADELVRGENTFFVATGVTDGALLEGVRKLGPVIRTESIVVRGRSGTVRRITADYRASRWE